MFSVIYLISNVERSLEIYRVEYIEMNANKKLAAEQIHTTSNLMKTETFRVE